MKDIAVAARSSADISKNHECCCALGPAFTNIGAICFLADRVQGERSH